MYPEIQIDHNKKPNRFYAVPLLGFVVKAFMIIPVGIELWALRVAQFFFSMLNSVNIFFRGRYWKMAYELNLGIMQLETNVAFFLYGITDTYPGFSLHTTNYSLAMDFNKTPNRVLATPLLGVIFRVVLLIPYAIYRQVISFAAFLSVVVGWMWVLFAGRYPETTYEIVVDSVRIDQAVNMYYLGMSDTYPSWKISMNHKTLKIVLLVLAALLTLMTFSGRFAGNHRPQPQMQKNYHMMNTVEKPTNQYTY